MQVIWLVSLYLHSHFDYGNATNILSTINKNQTVSRLQASTSSVAEIYFSMSLRRIQCLRACLKLNLNIKIRKEIQEM